MNSTRLLVVEDNAKMAGFIREGFSEQGYTVDVAITGPEGERLATGKAYDAIILDVMLPESDGVTVCRNLRGHGVTTPILMLTALSSTGDKVNGLEAGADDYLTKPFDFDECVARVRALMRRRQSMDASVLKFEDIEMDLLRRQVTRGGTKVKLTAKEFALLELFLRNPDKVLSRTAIGQQVWDIKFDADSNVVDVYVSMLRRKIDRNPRKRLIRTVVGRGYVLSAQRGDT